MIQKLPVENESNLAMALEILGNIGVFDTELQVLSRVFDTFDMLCSPSRQVWFSIADTQPYQIHIRPENDRSIQEKNESSFCEKILQTKQPFGLLEAGFWMRAGSAETPVGVLKLEDLAFPEYRHRYINEVSNLNQVVALAISNARTYEQLKRTEAELASEISDSVAATEELKRSERRYREIVELAQEGIWLIDTEANTVDVNMRMAEMLGCTVDEMLERPVFDFMDEEAREEAEVFLERRRQGIAEKYDFRFRTKAGAALWAMVSTAPMFDAQGVYAGAVRMVTDITERKRSEEAVRAQEEKLRLILASTGEGIFGLDMDGCCTFANRACIELLGFTDEEDLLGKRMHERIHHTRHDGTEYPETECPTYRSCTQRHVTFADDELLWRADGSAFHAEYQSFPMVRNDSVVGAVVSFADITERKLAEAALKQERDFAERLIETAPVIVLVLDPQGNIIRFNSFMEKLSGYSLAEVKGKNWFDTFLAECDVPSVAEVFARAKGGVSTHGNVNAILTRDGSERLIAWYDTTLQNSAGELSAVLAIGHDVTEQKAKEAQLLQAQKMETVGQLTGGIAHDFNNLLTVILGNLELLAKSIGPDCDPDAVGFVGGFAFRGAGRCGADPAPARIFP